MTINRFTFRSGAGIAAKFILAAAISFLIAGCAKNITSTIDSPASPQDNGAGVQFEPDPDWLDRRVSIENGEFIVNGKRLWINGVNTPWQNWNDFGGSYNNNWWDSEFKRLRAAGLNATRVWINCNGHGSLRIADDGTVSGASDKHWNDLDLFFETAMRNRIYIMATLLSFDHFKADNYRSERWRAMITDKSATRSFAENYTVPFVKRYGDNPWLWSIDLMNEADWVNESDKIAWDDISYYFAVNAAAIHENSKVLVTSGIAYPKWNVDSNGSGRDYRGNKVSDAYLQSLYPNKNAHLDFWSTHYYDWVGEHYGVPFYLTPGGNLGGSRAGWTGGWGLDPSKPAVIGECTAKGTRANYNGLTGNSIITDFESAFNNGWQGVMPWTSNYIDGNGGINDLSPGSLNMLDKYRDLIYPWD